MSEDLLKYHMKGHLIAFFTTVVWGMTLISTKILLKDFQPVEILFYRFLMAIILLFIICPKRMPKITPKQHLMLAFAGLFGICLYYLLENIALTYTYAENVGVISCSAPFFTAIVALMFMTNKEKPNRNFFIGFIAAITGIFIITFNASQVQISPIGDFLAILAAVSWALYSVLIKKITGISTLLITRQTFIYGLIFMLPALYIFNFHFGFERFQSSINLLNLLFLGLIASAICFATWNKAIKILGAVKSSVYIYLIPIITVVSSALILKEPITPPLITGTILTLAGLIISEIKSEK